MSLADAAAASIGGSFDRFDFIRGWIQQQISKLEGLDEESQDEMLDAHIGPDGDLHISDTREDFLEELREAINKLDDIRLLMQECIAAMPD